MLEIAATGCATIRCSALQQREVRQGRLNPQRWALAPRLPANVARLVRAWTFNYGAGSITANYDGANKHRTIIGDDVHIGSNCLLVAPLEIGRGATIGGGSTIVEGAPADELTLARARQVSIADWQRPVKKPKSTK